MSFVVTQGLEFNFKSGGRGREEIFTGSGEECASESFEPRGALARRESSQVATKLLFQVTTFQTKRFAPEKRTLVRVRCAFTTTENLMELVRVAARDQERGLEFHGLAGDQIHR